MDYLEFFSLTTEPFSNAPVSKRFYFDNAVHSRAMIRMKYTAEANKGLALLIGDIGTGKTTLARKMLEELPEDQYEVALLVIIHSSASPDWLMRRLAQQLGVEQPKHDKLELIRQLYDRLIEINESGKRTLVLIDEAQMLQTREVMEEFRGLLNLETSSQKLINFIFFGLPELESVLKLDPPLEQRVALKYRLSTLDRESCEKYIAHRLREAGGDPAMFSNSSIDEIFKYSRGIPRMINTLCDNCLFEGYLTKTHKVTGDMAIGIAVDLGLKAASEVARESQNRESEPTAHEEEPPPSEAKGEQDIDDMLDGLEVE